MANHQDISANIYQVIKDNTDGRIIKPVSIVDQRGWALVDTGCDVNLFRESFWKKLKGLSSTPSSMRLNGPADACFYTTYHFECKLKVNEESYNVEMHTVLDSVISYDNILGRPLFHTSVELRASPQSVTMLITHGN